MAGARTGALRGMLPWLALAAAIVVADQVTKARIQARAGAARRRAA